jgi:hypothetical protein
MVRLIAMEEEIVQLILDLTTRKSWERMRSKKERLMIPVFMPFMEPMAYSTWKERLIIFV